MMVLRLLLPLVLLLSRAAPAQPARPSPARARGLTGTYYAGRHFERNMFTRIDPTLNFRWWRQPPGPGLDEQYYSIRWTGRLFTPATGRYRFSVEVDDGVRVWVGGRRIIDAWGLHDNVQIEGSIDLIANHVYDLRIDYFNDILEGEIRLYWVIPDGKATGGLAGPPRQLIATEYLGQKPVRPVVKPPESGAPAATSQPNGVQPAIKQTAKPAGVPLAANQRTARTAPVPPRTVTQPTVETETAPAAPVFGQLTAGETVVLQHVFFEQSDYRLLPASYAELDKLVRTMQQQPTLRLELAGHTDNQGDPRLNLALSENRAKVVANYLMRHGISEDRLRSTGYGGLRPLTDNAGEAARARNRRVEFIVR